MHAKEQWNSYRVDRIKKGEIVRKGNEKEYDTIYNREWRNSPEILEKHREYMREYMRAYYYKHKEKFNKKKVINVD